MCRVKLEGFDYIKKRDDGMLVRRLKSTAIIGADKRRRSPKNNVSKVSKRNLAELILS